MMTIDLRPLLMLVLLLVPTAAIAEGEKKEEPTALTVFRQDLSKLAEDWRRLREETEPHRKKVEAARAACRQAERAHSRSPEQPGWQARWEATAPDRVQIQNSVFRHFLAWSQPAVTLFAVHDAKPLTPQVQAQVAKITADRVRAWVQVGEAGTLRGLLDSAPGGVARALALPGRAPDRRALLAAVVERTAATPGTTDLDALNAALAWETLFVAGKPPAEQLDLVSRDLILLFTERAEDGFSKSVASYYKPGRFEDRGFGPGLRDHSDQVRHFAWAFRMFAASERRDLTAKILHMKEEQDARARRTKLNRADVALNASARRLVESILGETDGGKPLDVERWPRLVREELAR